MTREPPFRSLIVLSWAGYVAAFAVTKLQPDLLSLEVQIEIQRTYMLKWLELSKSAHGALVTIVVFLLALVLANLAGAIGMFFFRRWGRSLSLWTTATLLLTLAALVLLGLTSGPHVISGLETWIQDLSLLSWGAALAVAYWSPVAVRFEKPVVRDDFRPSVL